jgi:hypothetical protein
LQLVTMALQWVKANYDLQAHQNWFCDAMLTSDGGSGSKFVGAN